MSIRDPYIGCFFDDYEILSRIARGTYGWVYLARHQVSGRRVAVKILADVFLSNNREKVRFLKEGFILELLRHPHILTVLRVDIQGDIPYIVTEYAPQGTLRDWLAKSSYRPLPEQLAISILLEIGAALHYMHRYHILHHDLKPANILFNQNYEVLLADFGIAIVRATLMQQRTAARLGTRPYMAPEQFRGMVGYQSDQYSLGCIAYEMLTGRTPFLATDSQEMEYHHVYSPVLPISYFNPRISPPVEQAILKALAKNSAQRHPGIVEFMKALRVPLLKDPLPSPSLQGRKQQNTLHLYAKEAANFALAIQHDPFNSIHYYNLSHTLKQLGWDEEAHLAYMKAVELDNMHQS